MVNPVLTPFTAKLAALCRSLQLQADWHDETQYKQQAPSMDLIDPTRYLAGLLFTVGLLFAAWYALRRFGPGLMRATPESGKSLRVLENLPLDAKRRLVRVQNGEKEHLLLLGISGDTLLESKEYIHHEHGVDN